jgi:glycolate oxidase FAD binding subunit
VDHDSCLIDDFGPLPVKRPLTVAELGALVRQAVADGQAIYPTGGRTMLDLGLPPSKPGVAVDLRSLDQVIDYPARDMTITVQTGITIERLQKILQVEKLKLPIDVPHPAQATLGGAIAVNVSGPRRLGFGTLRDYVIGITVVNDQGQEAKAGGRVVKNVAGYDLCKLYTGSLGTLGIITQVTLKLRPIPEESALVAFGCSAAQLGPLLDLLHRSRTRPVCVDVVNQAMLTGRSLLPERPWLVIVGHEDNRAAVDWQVQELGRLIEASDLRGQVAQQRLDDPGSWWSWLTDLESDREGSFTFKANLLSGGVPRFLGQAVDLCEEIGLHAHAGSGIIIGRAPSGLTLQRATAMLSDLRAIAVAEKGNLIIVRCPTEWKRSLPIWGEPRDDAWLMQAIKAKLDPKNLFNPGRFIGKI